LFARGRKKVLLAMATGSGKTATFSAMLKSLHEKGKPGMVIVRGRKLVDQAHMRLVRESVPHGVMMAGHRAWAPNLPIQVCSVDTLRARGIFPRAELIVVDEAHMATSDSFKNILSMYPNAFIVAVTATPFGKKSLRHIADDIVSPITVRELIADGFLVDGKYYAPSAPDLSGVKVSKMTGDYDVEGLEDVMGGSAIVGDVVTEWRKLGEGRPTLCFCVSVQHSLAVCAAFNQAGIRAEHVDAEVSDGERDAMIARLESGAVKVITSIGTMTTGVDIPVLGCLILARPTQSYNLHIQCLGRGTRPAPGKENFLVLDHSGNLMKHGVLTDVDKMEPSLDGKPKMAGLRTRTCQACFAVYETRPGACPMCGFIQTKDASARELTVVDGTLEEFKADPARKRFEELKRIKKLKGHLRGWMWHRMREEFGEDVANKYVPKRVIPDWVKR